MEENELIDKLRKEIIQQLNLEDLNADDIDPDAALFVEGLGLDSIDALELGVMLRKRYAVKIATVTDEVKAHFAKRRAAARRG